MPKYIVIAYERENGEVPVEKFLDSVDIKMRAKMFGMIGLLQEKGNQLSRIILTNGFVKKTQKTPAEEIRLAKERRADYLERVRES